MVDIPPQLLRRHRSSDAFVLRRVLDVVAEELSHVYADCSRHHRPRDNAQVFGLRVWVHVWAAIRERADEFPGARVVELNNTFFLRVADLNIAIHSLGHYVEDDIHSSFPEGSATQRSYGQRNATQLSLFDSAPNAPLPDERAYSLRDLIIGHFGNPEEGLAKWYLGAYIYDDQGRPRWAWAARQEVAETASARPDVTPYSERPEPTFEVKPRRRAEPRPSEGTSGA